MQAKMGDENAMNTLVRRHMPLVQMLSRRFSWQEDAFQAGCMGLVHAVRRFDETMGVAFSTYAVPVILGEMRKANYDRENWRAGALRHRVRAAREQFWQEHMREPSVQEVAEKVNCPAAEMMLLLEQMCTHREVQGQDIIEMAPDPHGQKWMDKILLKDMILRLTEDERQFLHLRFVRCCNQKEVARMLHTSQASVSRMEKRICHTLRAAWEDSEGMEG